MGTQRAVVPHACVSVDCVAAGNVACAYVEVVLGREKVVAVLHAGLKVPDDGAQCIGGWRYCVCLG